MKLRSHAMQNKIIDQKYVEFGDIIDLAMSCDKLWLSLLVRAFCVS